MSYIHVCIVSNICVCTIQEYLKAYKSDSFPPGPGLNVVIVGKPYANRDTDTYSHGTGLKGSGKSSFVNALGGVEFFAPSLAEKAKYQITGPCIMQQGNGAAGLKEIRHVPSLYYEVWCLCCVMMFMLECLHWVMRYGACVVLGMSLPCVMR